MDLQSLKPTTQTTLRKADKDAIPMTFDISKVKSTVTNPSQIFKGISVEDEQKILNKVNEMYPEGSKFEKQQAIQGLYNAALNSQKQKDIDAGRQQIKLDLINKANNEKSTKKQNEYISQVKKSDLADLIKEQLIKQGYKASDMMNLTDEGIIAGFLETNPEYKSAFNKYFYNGDYMDWKGTIKYNENSAIKLGKELGWIEKDTGDIAMDKLKGFGEGMAGWMPKRGEGVRDFLDWGLAGTDYNISREQSLDNTAFFNYVQDEYGTVPANLTDRDYKQAKKDFEANKEANKKTYTPTLSSAFTKMAMGLVDIAFTSGGIKGGSWGSKFLTSGLGKNFLRNNLFKAGFSTLADFDATSRAPEALGDALSWIGSHINELPGFSNIRENLQTEQDKADWDAFVAGNVLSLFRSGKRQWRQIKDADVQGWKDSYDKIKKGEIQEGVQTLKENAKENRKTKLEKEKLDAAQKVSQGEIETNKSTSKALDQLNEEGKLDNIKSVDDLQKNVTETIDRLKNEQTEIAKGETKRFSQSELGLPDEVDVLDENGNKSKQASMTYPVAKLLDNIIEHYEKTDPTQAIKWKSYKRSLEKGTLPAEAVLEIKREGNALNQDVYNNKTNLLKDTDKAEEWDGIMKKVNKVVEGLDIGEDLRRRDSQLSALYTLERGLKNIKKAEANYKKSAIPESSLASGIGKTVSRILGKLSFGTTNFFSKAFVSFLQEQLGASGFAKTKYNALEIAEKIPEFVEDYQNLLKKIEGEPVSSNQLEKLANEFIDKWELYAQQNEEDYKYF